MQILFYLVVTVHVIVCLFLIGVVLLQQGRSADLAGAFGGQGSQTAFGPRAAANVLTRLTTWSAIIFMATSISLTILYDRSTHSNVGPLRHDHGPGFRSRQVRQISPGRSVPARFSPLESKGAASRRHFPCNLPRIPSRSADLPQQPVLQ